MSNTEKNRFVQGRIQTSMRHVDVYMTSHAGLITLDLPMCIAYIRSIRTNTRAGTKTSRFNTKSKIQNYLSAYEKKLNVYFSLFNAMRINFIDIRNIKSYLKEKNGIFYDGSSILYEDLKNLNISIIFIVIF